MADPTSFFFGNAPPDSPLSYQALQTRRKIAEQLMGKRSPFPKTFGEGLTYAGERFADVMDMNRLDAAEKQQAAYEDKRLQDLRPGAENTAVAPTGQPTVSRPVSDAGTDATAPVQTAAAPYSAPGAAPGNIPLPPPRPARLRDTQLAQLQEDPALLRRAAAMTLGEVDRGTSTAERQTQFASALDRAGARGIPVAQALETYTGPGSRGYYPPDAFARGEKLLQKPGAFEAFQRDIATPVLRGADPGAAALGFTPTGNASGGVASRGVASGRYNVAGQFPGSAETYVQQESPTQLARLDAGRNRIAAAVSQPVQTAALTTPGVASDASPASAIADGASAAVAALPVQAQPPAQAPPLIPGDSPNPTTIPLAPAEVRTQTAQAGAAVPPPIAPYDPGPEPKREKPTPYMQNLEAFANDPRISPERRAVAHDKYKELFKIQHEDFTNKWTIWKQQQIKNLDPATGLDLRTKQLGVVKAIQDLEGEGWRPVPAEKMAQLPKVAEGQTYWENRRGELKFGPRPPATTTVNIDQKAEGKGLERLQTEMADHMVSQFKDGNTAADDLRTLSNMRVLASRVDTGAIAVAKQFAGRFGIKTEGISDIEALNATIKRIVPQQRVPGTGATSDFDAHMFEASVPGLMLTKEGNNLIMDTMENVARNKLARAEVAGKVISGELKIGEGTKELLKLQAEAKTMSDNVRSYLENKGVKLPESIIPSQKQTDDMAREWLKNNPNDPRAPAMRQKLGL